MPDWIDIDPESLDNAARYKLLIGSILPRPIAFVSSISEDGIANLAPFSFFMGVCSTPLTLCISVARRGEDGSKKDTLSNIEAIGEFVVHVVTEDIQDQMNLTAANWPPEISEIEAVGFTAIPSDVVKPPRIAESPIQLECVLHQLVELGDIIGSSTLIIGRVVKIHIRPDLYQDGKIPTQELRPIGRLAGSEYVRVSDIFDLPRPTLPPDLD